MILCGATKAFGPHTFSFAQALIEACDNFCCNGMQGGWWLQWLCYQFYAKYFCCSVTMQSCWHCAGLKLFEFHGNASWGQGDFRTPWAFVTNTLTFLNLSGLWDWPGHAVGQRTMGLIRYRSLRCSISIRLLCVGGNGLVATATGQGIFQLSVVFGIWIGPHRQFCRVSSSQLAAY